MCDNFNDFLNENWPKLVEHAEKMTGEEYGGLDPLLSKNEIIELAKELWEDMTLKTLPTLDKDSISDEYNKKLNENN